MNVYLVSCSDGLDLQNVFQVSYSDAINCARHMASVMDERMRMEHRWTGETEIMGENSVSVPLCPSKHSHEPTWDRTGVTAMLGRQSTAPAMARCQCIRIHSFCLLMQSNSYRQGYPCLYYKGISGDWR